MIDKFVELRSLANPNRTNEKNQAHAHHNQTAEKSKKNLKAARQKQHVAYRRNKYSTAVHFSSETREARRNGTTFWAERKE